MEDVNTMIWVTENFEKISPKDQRRFTKKVIEMGELSDELYEKYNKKDEEILSAFNGLFIPVNKR